MLQFSYPTVCFGGIFGSAADEVVAKRGKQGQQQRRAGQDWPKETLDLFSSNDDLRVSAKKAAAPDELVRLTPPAPRRPCGCRGCCQLHDDTAHDDGRYFINLMIATVKTLTHSRVEPAAFPGEIPRKLTTCAHSRRFT